MQRAEGGATHGVRHDVDAEVVGIDCVHGEADAVHGNRAFGGDVAGERRGGGEGKAFAARVGFAGEQFADAIDVAADEVAAERGGKGQRVFEVDRVAGLQRAEGGQAQGFVRDVGAEVVGAERNGGEADAADGDAVAEGAAAEVKGGGGDGEGAVVAVVGAALQGAGGFYDACEHGFSGVRRRRRSAPMRVLSSMWTRILSERCCNGGSCSSSRAPLPSRQGAR